MDGTDAAQEVRPHHMTATLACCYTGGPVYPEPAMKPFPDLPCLPLDSRRWGELEHAYGDAADIPALLRQLDTTPGADDEQEPWFSLWSALAHQGDVNEASFAAVPHVVRALARAPLEADTNYLQFPAVVEIARQHKQITVPPDLHDAYFGALKALPGLIAQAAGRDWDDGFLACALAALAAAKGFGSVAEAALEMTPDVASEFMDWFDER